MPNPLQRTYRLDSEKLAALMVEKRLTQEQLALDANMSTVTLSNIMNGRPAYRQTIVKLADALGVEDIRTLMITEPPITLHRETTDDVEVYVGRYDDVDGRDAAIQRARLKGKRLWMMLAPSIIAMLCCLSGLAPIDARYCYIAGTVFAALGVALALQKKFVVPLPMKLLLVLSLVAMVLNIAAYVAWPRVIGFFPVKGGYTFGYGMRKFGRPPVVLHEYMIKCNPEPLINEYFTITIDAENPEEGIFSGISPAFFRSLTPGTHTVTVQLGSDSLTKHIVMGPEGQLSDSDKPLFEFGQHHTNVDALTNIIILCANIYFAKSNRPDEPWMQNEDILLILDNKEVTVPKNKKREPYAKKILATTVGWHTLSAKVSGRELYNGKVYAHPLTKNKEHLNSFEMNSTTNVIYIYNGPK